MEQPKKERSLHLLTLLMQPGRKYSVQDLADELDVDRRTIYRYIRTFNEAGFVVQTSNRHVRLARHTAVHKSLSDLLYFNREEAITLYNAIDAIESDTQFKMELKEKLASIYGTKTIQDKLIRLEKNRLTKALMEAIEARECVQLCNYSSPHSQSVSSRVVEPFALGDDKKSVWAYEIESGLNKLFVIGRIESIKPMHTPWLNGRRHRKGFIDNFRILSLDGRTYPVCFHMNRRAFNLLVEEYPLTEEHISSVGNECWTYEAEVSNYLGVGRFLMGLADCVQIETPELREYMQKFVLYHILEHTGNTE